MLEDSREISVTLNMLAKARLELGDAAGALRLLGEALKLSVNSEDRLTAGQARVTKADAHILVGDVVNARKSLREALDDLSDRAPSSLEGIRVKLRQLENA
jgi:ATP/maltotriose-dependent transcriptional regulator MalT